MAQINLKKLATKDDDQRGKGDLRSPQFRKTLRYVWPHRRYLIMGTIAAVFAAVLSAVGIGTIVPVMNILLQKNGLHGWVDRSVAESRTGIQNLETAYVLDEMEGQASADDWFQNLAEAPDGTAVKITTEKDGKLVVRDVTLGSPFWAWKLISPVASLVPRDVKRSTAFAYVMVFLFVAVLLGNIARFFAEYYVAIGVYRSLMDLRRKLYAHVLLLPMSFFSQGTADLVSRFVQDTQEIQRGLMAMFGKAIREPLRAAALLVFALCMNWRITLATMLLAPVAVFVLVRVGHSIRKANLRLLRVYGSMIDALTTTLQAIRVVKAYTTEKNERVRLWRIDERAFKQQIRITMLRASLRPMLEVLAVLSASVAIAWLGKQVLEGKIKVADFIALIGILAASFDPLRRLSDVYTRIARAAAGADRVFSVLEMTPEAELLEGAVQLPELQNEIAFKDVTFTYPNAERPALSGVNLTVKRGEAVAVVGPNGSGKTTLVNMLPRFFDTDSGTILFDGVDITTGTLKSLRQQISLVTQDAVIFEATLAENIAYGSDGASREKIEAAARKAFADEFIRDKDQGYDTMVGERGSTLSGGQKQRITIARAVLRDAPIFIFDEATSQIDAESEQKIQVALKEFSKGRTTFIVAHRLSTIRFADRIVVMDQGRMIDTGKHEELLARCELYATLCKTQLLE